MPFATKSLSFNGTTKYVTLGDVLGFDTSHVVSISFWMKSTDTQGHIISKMGGATAYLGWGIHLQSGAVRVFFNHDDAGGSQLSVTTVTTGWADGNWHHVVMTWDGNASPGAAGMNLYIDGVHQVLTTMSDTLGTDSITSTSEFNISGRTNGSDLLAGNICQLAVYAAVLTRAEVVRIYNGGNPVDPKILATATSLIAYLPLGDNDTHPTAFERALDPVVPMAAGHKSPYYQLPNDTVPVEWARGVGFPDMASFYPGPGGTFCYFSTKFAETVKYYRAGPISKRLATDSWSVSFWVKYTATGAGTRMFFTRAVNSDRDGILIKVLSATPGSIEVAMRGGNFTGYLRANTTTTTFNDDAWHHVVVTYDGSVARVSGLHIWVDNVDEPLTTTQDTQLTGMVDDSLNLGGYSDTADGFDGYMAQVSMYGAVLNSTAVAAIYNGGVPLDVSGLASAGDLLSWWPMGSEDGDQDRPGELVNMDSSDVSLDGPGGVLGSSLLFVYSSTKRVNIGDAFNFEHDQPFSFSCWVKTTAGGWLFGKQKTTSSTGYLFGIHPSGWPTGGRLELALVDTWITATTNVQGITNVNDGAWHHVVVTYSGNSDVSGMKFYVDDTLLTNANQYNSMTASDSIIDTAPLYLGDRQVDETVYSLGGRMTGNAIYAKELSAAEVTAIYNTGTPVDPTTLSSATHLVGYWPLGAGYYSGVMTNMSGADIQDDAPSVSTLTTEKSWTTVANYDLGGSGEAVDALGKLLLLDWKNKLAANGWTVIGSGNTVGYEWQGSTAGGSYGGTSTNAYDIWAAVGDIIFRDSDLGLGAVSWVVLQSPATSNGQFWLTVAWYGPTEENVTAYISNSVPTEPTSPLVEYPVPSTVQYFWLFDREQFYNFYNTVTAVRTYLSVCSADGSFIFGRQTMNESDWNSMTMFHVLTDTAFMPDDFPMRAIGYGHYWTAWGRDDLSYFRCYTPSSGPAFASPMMPAHEPTLLEMDLYTEDVLGGGTPSYPLVLVRRPAAYDIGPGAHSILGIVPDMYLSNSSVARGTMAPYEAPYLFTKFESYLWMPGDTEPSYT
jgi:hypothetical protein